MSGIISIQEHQEIVRLAVNLALSACVTSVRQRLEDGDDVTAVQLSMDVDTDDICDLTYSLWEKERRRRARREAPGFEGVDTQEDEP